MISRPPNGLWYDIGIAVEQTRGQHLVVDGQGSADALNPLSCLEKFLTPRVQRIHYCSDVWHPRKPVYLLVERQRHPWVVILIARLPSGTHRVPLPDPGPQAVMNFLSQHFPLLREYKLEALAEEDARVLGADITQAAQRMCPLRSEEHALVSVC